MGRMEEKAEEVIGGNGNREEQVREKKGKNDKWNGRGRRVGNRIRGEDKRTGICVG